MPPENIRAAGSLIGKLFPDLRKAARWSGRWKDLWDEGRRRKRRARSGCRSTEPPLTGKSDERRCADASAPTRSAESLFSSRRSERLLSNTSVDLQGVCPPLFYISEYHFPVPLNGVFQSGGNPCIGIHDDRVMSFLRVASRNNKRLQGQPGTIASAAASRAMLAESLLSP